MGESDDNRPITMSVRCANGDRLNVVVDKGDTVLMVKTKLSKDSNIEPQYQRLIFKGKLLKDEDSFDDHPLQEGYAMHLVSSAPTKPTQSSQNSDTNTGLATSNPQSVNNSGNSSGSSFDQSSQIGGIPNFAQMMNNPQMQNLFRSVSGSMGESDTNRDDGQTQPIQQFLNSPLAQSMINNLMSNPGAMEELVSMNPGMQSALMNNPQAQEIVNNPQIMRQALNALRNFGGNDNVNRNNNENQSSQYMNNIQQTMNQMQQDPQYMSRMMQMMSGVTGGGNTTGAENTSNFANTSNSGDKNWDEIYCVQLKALVEMGFTDNHRNIEALRMSNGSLEGAINILLE